jgi:hypothetical protein
MITQPHLIPMIRRTDDPIARDGGDLGDCSRCPPSQEGTKTIN